MVGVRVTERDHVEVGNTARPPPRGYHVFADVEVLRLGSAGADAAFSPTEPRPPAVKVRLAQSRTMVSFGSEVQTGLSS